MKLGILPVLVLCILVNAGTFFAVIRSILERSVEQPPRQLEKGLWNRAGGLKNTPTAPAAIVTFEAVLAERKVQYRLVQSKLLNALKTHEIVTGLLSAAPNRPQRQAIRDTWARNRHNQVFFVVAGNYSEALAEELQTHGDLLWLGVPEEYSLLTYKSLGYFAAIQQGLQQLQALNVHVALRYAFKSDDDTYIDLERVQHEWLNGTTVDYTGLCTTKSIIHRDPSHKWYVSEDQYPGEYYKPYAMGAGYALSRHLLETQGDCLGKAMATAPFLPIEDVALGEVVRQCIPGDTCVSPPPKFIDQFDDLSNSKNPLAVIYEIKIEQALRLMHAELCIDHPDRLSCQGGLFVYGDEKVSLPFKKKNNKLHDSCVTDQERTKPCKTFTHCGGKHTADNCGLCPDARAVGWKGVHPDWCNGDCHWCPYGTVGDDMSDTSLTRIRSGLPTLYQAAHFQCASLESPCREEPALPGTKEE